jgi:uncharacterized lipoprotein YbaY/heat shock protein HslJ
MVLCFALRWIGLALPVCALLACTSLPNHPGSPLVVTGSATYRERMALPPGASFEASVEDVSRAGAESLRIGEVRIESPRVPVRFSIPVDPAQVLPNGRYAVRARIVSDGILLYTSDTDHPVLGASGTTHVDILLRRVDAAPVEARPRRMQGHYTYMADSALFTDCASGRRLSVADEGDHLALQRAYVAARPAPGAPMLVTVDASVHPRPSSETGRPPQPKLVIAKYVALGSGSCGAPQGTTALENTHWKLVELRGHPVAATASPREPHFILQPQQKRLVGSGGCNRLTGGYTLSGEKLTFVRSTGTLMTCSHGMELERDFLAALSVVARWRLVGERLDLLDAAGTTTARFEAVRPR